MKKRCPNCGRFAKVKNEFDTNDPFSGAIWRIKSDYFGWVMCKHCQGNK